MLTTLLTATLASTLAMLPWNPPPGLTCEPVEGTITLTPDPSCAIASSPWRSWLFPQSTFIEVPGVPTCFIAETTVTIGGHDYVGSSELGRTDNTFPALPAPLLLATAAHVLELDPVDGGPMGTIFLRHVGVVDTAAFTVQEELSVLGGVGSWLAAKGTLELSGDPLAGATMDGTLCGLPWLLP